MTPFELAEPKTLREAVALLDADDPTVRPIAGGTALMLMMKAGVFRPSKLVSLAAVKELVAIDSVNGELKIGAMTPLAALERSDAVKKHAPVITKTLRTLSNIRVRNVATVGGSLAHADPHMEFSAVQTITSLTRHEPQNNLTQKSRYFPIRVTTSSSFTKNMPRLI